MAKNDWLAALRYENAVLIEEALELHERVRETVEESQLAVMKSRILRAQMKARRRDVTRRANKRSSPGTGA